MKYYIAIWVPIILICWMFGPMPEAMQGIN